MSATTAWIATGIAAWAEPGWVLGASGAYYGLGAYAAGARLKARDVRSCVFLMITLIAFHFVFGGDPWAHGAAMLTGISLGRMRGRQEHGRPYLRTLLVGFLSVASCIICLFAVPLHP